MDQDTFIRETVVEANEDLKEARTRQARSFIRNKVNKISANNDEIIRLQNENRELAKEIKNFSLELPTPVEI